MSATTAINTYNTISTEISRAIAKGLSQCTMRLSK